MGYTPEMRELIKRVEATRPARVEKARRGDHFPALTLEERAVVLEKFHPDYQKEGRSKRTRWI
jgi:succinate dehydrogenase / fumarate reductase flavoprotein subunit/L-aspartate oxidase